MGCDRGFLAGGGGGDHGGGELFRDATRGGKDRDAGDETGGEQHEAGRTGPEGEGRFDL